MTTPTLVTVENGIPVTTSQQVAYRFMRPHKDVLKSIRELDCSPEFASANFFAHVENIRIGATFREQPYYTMTKDGFVFLAMGFTGAKAAQFKEAYITAFNALEQKALHSQQFFEQHITQLKNALLQANPQLKKVYHYKTLGLSNVEVAKLLNVSPATADRLCARLRGLGLLPPAKANNLSAYHAHKNAAHTAQLSLEV